MKRVLNRLREFWEDDIVFTASFFWREFHRTDLGDEEHYPNGFRKISCLEPIQYFNLACSLICLILALFAE